MKCPHCKKLIPSPTAKQYQVWHLRYIEGKPVCKIAETLKISTQAVYARLQRLEKICPFLFTPRNCPKTHLSFDESRDSMPKQKF